MRRTLCAIVLLGASALAAAPTDPKTVPDDAPGTFLPYNANGDKFRHRYHDPISDHGLDPQVLYFTKDWQSDAFKNLLKQLNAVAEDSKDLRLAVCVVVLSDELKPATPPVAGEADTPEKRIQRDKRADELNKIEDRRRELAGQLEGLAKGLPHVVMCLAHRDDVGEYVPAEAVGSYWLLDQLRVRSHIDQKDDKLDDKQVEALVADLNAKMKVVRESKK